MTHPPSQLAPRISARRGETSYRAAAKEIGVGVGTLHRAAMDVRVSEQSLEKIRAWLAGDVGAPTSEPKPAARETVMVYDTLTGQPHELVLPRTVPAPPQPEDVPEGYRRNTHGRLVPDEMIQDHERRRDDLVRYLHRRGDAARQAVAHLRRDAIEMTFDQIRYLVEMYGGAADWQAPSGNVSLTSYDGALRVCIEQADRITLDERVHVARELFDRVLTRWSEGAPQELKLLVREAFALDRTGSLNVRKLIDISRYKSEDVDWQAGCRAIHDAITTSRTKWYVRLYRRHEDGKKFVYLPIDLQKTPASEPDTAAEAAE